MRAMNPVPAQVYPRVCGGTPDEGEGARELVGLSPRVRGNQPHPHRAVDRLGSIPACAGEPSSCRA